MPKPITSKIYLYQFQKIHLPSSRVYQDHESHHSHSIPCMQNDNEGILSPSLPMHVPLFLIYLKQLMFEKSEDSPLLLLSIKKQYPITPDRRLELLQKFMIFTGSSIRVSDARIVSIMKIFLLKKIVSKILSNMCRSSMNEIGFISLLLLILAKNL